MPLLTVDNLTLSYHGRAVLRNLDLVLHSGEIICIEGPSGSGKTSLLHCLCGAVPDTVVGSVTGDVLYSGKPVQSLTPLEQAATFGVVFQEPELQLFLPTVEDELAFAPENLCLPPEQVCKRVTEALVAVGIPELRSSRPEQLSGGQMQLVALAAVLTMQPTILLLDEIFSRMDSDVRHRLSMLFLLLSQNGHSIIMLEHHPEAAAIATRRLALHDGKLTEVPHG